MKKNGFTLVELLAVIAILAILVIMALPAVLNMFTKARVDTFENEVKTIYRTAQQNYLLNGGAAVSYGNKPASSSVTCKALDMTGNASLKYYISINGSGEVTKIEATNGTYYYSKTPDSGKTGFEINEIDVPDTPLTSGSVTDCPAQS